MVSEGTTVPQVLIVSARNPYQVTFLLAASIAGFAGFFTGGAPSSKVLELLGPMKYLWFGGLLIGGSVALLSLWRGRNEVALLWERVGLILLAGMLLAFGIATISVEVLTVLDYVFLGLAVAAGGLALWWRKFTAAVLIGAVSVIALNSTGGVLIFGFAVANLYRIQHLNNVLKQRREQRDGDQQ